MRGIATLVTVLFLTSCSAPAPPKATQNAPAPTPAPARISRFYVSPPAQRGEKTLLCYGVENATEVRLDPPVEKVWPALSRCFEIEPAKTVKYTLTAIGAGGSVSQSVTVRPARTARAAGPEAHLVEVSINKLDFAAGETATVCYKAENAKNVSITPGTWIEPHTPALGCVSDKPQHDTTYVVTATGAAGDTDVERVTARVK